jgi:hypothetical protein
MMVVVPSRWWMIVRVGCITVPAADRSATGYRFLGAAWAAHASAVETVSTAAATAMTRMGPHFIATSL